MSVGKHIDFGMTDERGRKIGARVRLYTRDGGDCDSPIDVEVWSTRNSEVFGRLPPRKTAWSLGAAHAEVRRRLTSMIKRYAKKLNLLAEGTHAKWIDKETENLLTLRDADDMDVDERYLVICEEHATILGVPTKADGRRTSGLDFCDECREECREEPSP